ncbi:MAG: CehA/McbA family metallohydrolase, partial [Verrucomicrobiota bacterium]
VETEITITSTDQGAIDVPLERWIDPMAFGFYCGDHHIHGAGCSHYTTPTKGVLPEHLFQQIKGEGLNVGCVLTWGPCYDYQRHFFSPRANDLSDSMTLMKYDVEVSGFGSAALGHVCLLNLTDQTYPGSDGRSDQGWPTWTVPVMRWCREQGGVTGYPHSALGMNPRVAADFLLKEGDRNEDGHLSPEEGDRVLLPTAFGSVDRDQNQLLSREEIRNATDEAADQLPNLALPAMDGKGAMEIVVSVPEGVCDFVSAMDTERLPEWNTWYHLLNCGFPLKLSGETDFPCMSSRRVGQGRVYVHLGRRERLQFGEWIEGLASGRSYVSDGFAHAVRFEVSSPNSPDEVRTPGPESLLLTRAGDLQIKARVAFAPAIPKGVAYGTISPATGEGKRVIGDTVTLHGERQTGRVAGIPRLVELVVNGEVRGTKTLHADGTLHDLLFETTIEESSWVALRSFPQLHTNPVTVLVDGKPIRASRASARWCETGVRMLWQNRHRFISEAERPAARAAYDRAIATYRRIAEEAGERP